MGGVRCTMKFAFVTIIAFFLSLLCQRIAIKIRRLYTPNTRGLYSAGHRHHVRYRTRPANETGATSGVSC